MTPTVNCWLKQEQHPNPTVRRQAVAITLAQSGAARDEANDLLGRGFLGATQPLFTTFPKATAWPAKLCSKSRIRTPIRK